MNTKLFYYKKQVSKIALNKVNNSVDTLKIAKLNYNEIIGSCFHKRSNLWKR